MGTRLSIPSMKGTNTAPVSACDFMVVNNDLAPQEHKYDLLEAAGEERLTAVVAEIKAMAHKYLMQRLSGAASSSPYMVFLLCNTPPVMTMSMGQICQTAYCRLNVEQWPRNESKDEPPVAGGGLYTCRSPISFTAPCGCVWRPERWVNTIHP